MVWYRWKWWRLAWSENRGHRTSDDQGVWQGYGHWYILLHRFLQPMAQKTLYKQAYYRLLERGHSHEDAVDIAQDTREAFSNHPALSLKQLDYMIECNIEGDPA